MIIYYSGELSCNGLTKVVSLDIISEQKINTRRFVVLVLVVFIIEEAVSAMVFLSMRHYPVLRRSLLLPVATFITHWMIPLSIVILVESRDLSAIGLTVKRVQADVYFGYVFIGLVLPAFVVRVDSTLAIEFVEQIVYIGVAEEIFFRGYLLHRLVEWIGRRKGIPLGALTFGLAHIISRVCQHGVDYPLQDLMLGFQTFLGGMLLGYIYLRTNSILPGAIIHTSANMYLEKLIEMFGR